MADRLAWCQVLAEGGGAGRGGLSARTERGWVEVSPDGVERGGGGGGGG